jgi:ribosomal protein S18 acetylase RimI-like enzyme
VRTALLLCSGASARYLPRMVTIRSATASDEERLGRFGCALMRQHHAADPRRFLQVEHPEAGYGRFLISQLSNPNSLVLVAEQAGTVVGYIFADVESTNWMELRGPCGVVQDVYVDESARRLGAGRELMRAAIAWIRSKGRSQVVLMTKSRNEHAQHLFASLGFRPTMIEMTLDQDSKGDE